MANYANLKADIQAVIKQNGNQEITGNLLQQSLIAMINSLGNGYLYKGIATPSTNPGTPDQNVFYIASTAGIYSNMGVLTLDEGEVAIIRYNGSWGKDTTGIATAEGLSELRRKEELDVNPFPIPVDISQLPRHNGTLVDANWYDIPRARHVVIPFRAGDTVRLKPSLVSGSSSSVGEFYAWLTSSYTPPTTTSTIPYVPGTSRIFARTNTFTEATAPEGTAYLCLVIVDGSLNTVTWECEILSNTYMQQYVGKLSQLETTDKSTIVGAINENKQRIDANAQKLNVLDVSIYDTSAYTKSPYIIWAPSQGSLDVVWTNANAKHFVVPVNAGDILMLECNHYSYYAWLTDAYTPPTSTSDTVPTVPQTGRYAISANTPTKLIVPPGAAYLYLVDIDGNGDQISNKLNTMGSTINNIYGDIAQIEENLLPYTQHQITNVAEHSYIPDSSASNPNWYLNSSSRHIAIPCSEGDSFVLQAHTTIGFHYLWLTSAYTPPTAAGGAVPSVNGMGRIWLAAAAMKIVTAPSGAAYLLVVTVNGTPAPTYAQVSYIGSQKLLLDQLRIGVNGLVGDIHSYSGEKIELNKRYGLLKVPGVTKFLNGEYPQGMAIYGGYMFRIYNGAGCEIYDISSGSPVLIETTTLACASYDPHCNSAQFAPSVVSGDFPYLYVAACRNAIRECYVVSVAIDGSSTLIQKITFPALDELPAAMAFNVIIGDDGYLYCSGTKNGKLYFAKFKCPPTTEAEVTLTAADLVLSAVEDGYDYDTYTYQGIAVHQGKLYFVYGGSYNERGIWVYNTATFQKTSDIRMTGIVNVEFEDADIYDSELYLQVVDTCYYKLTFNP